MCEINWPESVPHLIDVELPEKLNEEERRTLRNNGYAFHNVVDLVMETFEDPQARAIVLGLLESRMVYFSIPREDPESYWSGVEVGYLSSWNYVMGILGYSEVYDL